jgi:nucleoside-diphosphate-sugar epimerase
MIAIMGATGHTGRPLAEALLSRGEKVRVLGRDEAKLRPLVDKGAEAAPGDPADAAYLARAFRGADAVYTLLPPDPVAADVRAWQDRVGEATVKALRESGVKRVAFLSSQGAEHASGTGPIAGLHAQENRLRELGIDVAVLRPAYFFENFHASLRDLLGPRTMTMAEATRIIGGKIGRPDLAYVQFPYEGFAQALVQAGLSADMAGQYAEMSKAINEKLIGLPARTAANTTPTTFETFADDLAQAYEG